MIEGPPAGRYWAISKDKLEALDADNRIWWGKDGNGVPSLKRFLSEVKQGRVPQTFWPYEEVGHTQDAKKETVAIFGSEVFATPKPELLIQGGSPGHAARPRPRPWLGTPLRPVKRMALRGGTGGSLDGRGALARPGPRMRAAFGLTEPPASVIAAPARGSRNLLRPELSSPPRPRGRGRALQATSWTRHPTAKDSEATCGKVWPRKRPREPREDRHPKGRDLRAERTMPPRRSAGSERDGGRRTWGAGTGGAQSSGSGPVQPAHE